MNCMYGEARLLRMVIYESVALLNQVYIAQWRLDMHEDG